MCKVMEEMRENAKKEEYFNTVLSNIKTLMAKLKYTAEQALELLDIPHCDWASYKAQL